MAKALKTLKTKSGVWSSVYRRICDYLESDPDMQRLVGDGLRTWKGSPGDKAPLAPATGRPIVRTTPTGGGVDWQTPELQTGTLVVKVEIAIASLCVDDVLDLWEVIGRPISPGVPGLREVLVALGAETGEIVFSDPAFDPRPDAEPEGYFYATGAFRLRIQKSVFP